MHDQVSGLRASGLARGFIQRDSEVTWMLHGKKIYLSTVSLTGGIQTAYCSHFSCTTVTQVSGPVCISFIVFSLRSFYLPLIIFA